MASERAPTLAMLRREARRVYGRGVSVFSGAWADRWVVSVTEDVGGDLLICIDAPTRADAHRATMAALKALPTNGGK